MTDPSSKKQLALRQLEVELPGRAAVHLVDPTPTEPRNQRRASSTVPERPRPKDERRRWCRRRLPTMTDVGVRRLARNCVLAGALGDAWGGPDQPGVFKVLPNPSPEEAERHH